MFLTKILGDNQSPAAAEENHRDAESKHQSNFQADASVRFHVCALAIRKQLQGDSISKQTSFFLMFTLGLFSFNI